MMDTARAHALAMAVQTVGFADWHRGDAVGELVITLARTYLKWLEPEVPAPPADFHVRADRFEILPVTPDEVAVDTRKASNA